MLPTAALASPTAMLSWLVVSIQTKVADTTLGAIIRQDTILGNPNYLPNIKEDLISTQNKNMTTM